MRWCQLGILGRGGWGPCMGRLLGGIVGSCGRERVEGVAGAKVLGGSM